MCERADQSLSSLPPLASSVEESFRSLALRHPPKAARPIASFAPLPSPFIAVALLLLGGLTTAEGCFSAIFSFGDSITDTGYAVRLGGVGGPAGIPPYGRTFFGRPIGLYSDGRVILDFIAQGLGLPLVRPYLEGGYFRKGVNFAVAGATALDLDFFSAKGVDASRTRKSLRVQIEEFKQLLPSLSSGFKATLGACCGSNGRYNVSRTVQCGHKEAKVCSDPSAFISWDGIHLTEAAYGTIAQSLLEGAHANPPLFRACPITRQSEIYDF